jgi:hypothetical protein
MELRTVEVRWFLAGGCPGAIAGWFTSGPAVGEPEHRIDEYLAIPDRDDFGVKRRAGIQLDLKLRTARRTDVVLADGLDGRTEAWTKWSFPLAPESTVPADGSWVPVEKRRWSRLYASTGGDTVSPVAPGSITTNGCAVELVEVAIGGRDSWGFGLEAFGAGDLGRVLTATCRALEADTPLGDITFSVHDSHSYPSWLLRERAGAG